MQVDGQITSLGVMLQISKDHRLVSDRTNTTHTHKQQIWAKCVRL